MEIGWSAEGGESREDPLRLGCSCCGFDYALCFARGSMAARGVKLGTLTVEIRSRRRVLGEAAATEKEVIWGRGGSALVRCGVWSASSSLPPWELNVGSGTTAPSSSVSSSSLEKKL